MCSLYLAKLEKVGKNPRDHLVLHLIFQLVGNRRLTNLAQNLFL